MLVMLLLVLALAPICLILQQLVNFVGAYLLAPKLQPFWVFWDEQTFAGETSPIKARLE